MNSSRADLVREIDADKEKIRVELAKLAVDNSGEKAARNEEIQVSLDFSLSLSSPLARRVSPKLTSLPFPLPRLSKTPSLKPNSESPSTKPVSQPSPPNVKPPKPPSTHSTNRRRSRNHARKEEQPRRRKRSRSSRCLRKGSSSSHRSDQEEELERRGAAGTFGIGSQAEGRELWEPCAVGSRTAYV